MQQKKSSSRSYSYIFHKQEAVLYFNAIRIYISLRIY